jgi:hypothetical protein
VKVIKNVPDPKLPVLHEVKGVRKTLSDWAQHTGIKKNSLWSRLQAGLTMADAVARGRGGFPASDVAGKLPGNSDPKSGSMAPSARSQNAYKKARSSVRRGGIEPPTRGFSGAPVEGSMFKRSRKIGPFAKPLAARVPQPLIRVVQPRTARRRGARPKLGKKDA